MKKSTLIITIISFLLLSCGGTKKTENAISSGNYDQAFEIAVQKLNKDKAKNAKQIPYLKDAFDKAAKRDLDRINALKQQNNSANLEQIYKTYMKLDVRQDEIILLEPLYFEGQKYDFQVVDYTKDIAKAKKKYSDQLYHKALPLMNNSKENSRQAFKILEDLQYINPNYRTDLAQLIRQTKKRGSNFVFVKLQNKVVSQLKDSTSKSILKSFTNINTGNFTNKWIQFHDKKDNTVTYDYEATIYLDKITVVPEKTKTQVVNQQKEVQNGWNYKLDAKGNVMKDEKGNDIKTPKMEKVSAQVTLYQQSKSTILDGKVTLKNLKTSVVSSPTPINGEAKLEHIYGTYKGNPKAIDQKYYEALKKKVAVFPPNSDFNKFALQTFKQKVENFFSQQKF
jgi:hypothetical protein